MAKCIRNLRSKIFLLLSARQNSLIIQMDSHSKFYDPSNISCADWLIFWYLKLITVPRLQSWKPQDWSNDQFIIKQFQRSWITCSFHCKQLALGCPDGARFWGFFFLLSWFRAWQSNCFMTLCFFLKFLDEIFILVASAKIPFTIN